MNGFEFFNYRNFLHGAFLMNRRGPGIDMAVKSSLEIAGSTDQEGTRMVLPFQPLSLAFNHGSYYVDMPAVSHLILTQCILL